MPARNPRTLCIFDYAVARVTLEEAVTWAYEATQRTTPRLLVTLNPEIVVQAEQHPDLKGALMRADLRVADGIGLMWAARRLGTPLPARVPGVELMTMLLARGGSGLRVYFLGGKPGVAERAAEVAHARYGVQVAGVQHGYFKRPQETPDVAERIAKSGATLLLAGLGEGQELFLHAHREALGVPLMIGVGGALDVLSGEVTRAPVWTHKLGLEWAYRIGSDPKRWHRFPRLLAFAQLVLRSAPNASPR